MFWLWTITFLLIWRSSSLWSINNLILQTDEDTNWCKEEIMWRRNHVKKKSCEKIKRFSSFKVKENLGFNFILKWNMNFPIGYKWVETLTWTEHFKAQWFMQFCHFKIISHLFTCCLWATECLKKKIYNFYQNESMNKM